MFKLIRVKEWEKVLFELESQKIQLGMLSQNVQLLLTIQLQNSGKGSPFITKPTKAEQEVGTEAWRG